MSIRRVAPNIATDSADESRKFYTDSLGFRVAMGMGWIVTLMSPTHPTAQVSLVRGQESSPPPATHRADPRSGRCGGAARRGRSAATWRFPSPTLESSGGRRLAVIDPNGAAINLTSHPK